MAQTTSGLSFVKAVVFISDDAAVSWTDVSGHAASVAVSGGERAKGVQNTLDGVTPIVKAGDRTDTVVTVRFVFTEGDDPEPFELLRAVHEGESAALEVQWAPAGGGATFWLHADDGILTDLLYPGGESGDGTVIMSQFVVACSELTKAAASIAAV